MSGEDDKFHSLLQRVAALEANQDFFQKSVLAHMDRVDREEKNIYNLISELNKGVNSVPEKVHTRLNACKDEIETNAKELYARKHEVVTPRTLTLALTLAALVASGAGWLFDKMEHRHDQQTAQVQKQ